MLIYPINFQSQLLENAPNVIKITDIYKLDEILEETMRVEYGHWNFIDGLIIYEPNIWKRRSNLQGHHFR